MQRVYVELVLLDNFLMDFFILYFTMRFSSHRVHFGRISAGAGIGAIYAAISVALPLLQNIFFKVFGSLLMLIPIQNIRRTKSFFRTLGVFYAVTFLFGGAVLAAMYFFDSGQLNGATINWPILRYLLLGGAVAIIAVEILLRIARPIPGCYYEIIATIASETFKLTGFLDTGNQLKDAGGSGVIVADREAVFAQLSDSLKAQILSGVASAGLTIRPFYFSTVAGNACVPGVLPESLLLYDKKHCYTAKAYLALSDSPIAGDYNALLSAQMRLFKT